METKIETTVFVDVKTTSGLSSRYTNIALGEQLNTIESHECKIMNSEFDSFDSPKVLLHINFRQS